MVTFVLLTFFSVQQPQNVVKRQQSQFFFFLVSSPVFVVVVAAAFQRSLLGCFLLPWKPGMPATIPVSLSRSGCCPLCRTFYLVVWIFRNSNATKTKSVKSEARLRLSSNFEAPNLLSLSPFPWLPVSFSPPILLRHMPFSLALSTPQKIKSLSFGEPARFLRVMWGQ